VPYLCIKTNQPLAPEPRRELLQEASRTVAQLLGKPERYVMVSIDDGREMLFAGSDAPLAYLELKSIGLPGGRTAELSAGLCTLVQSALGIPADRIYIEFSDAARHLWGWDGATF